MQKVDLESDGDVGDLRSITLILKLICVFIKPFNDQTYFSIHFSTCISGYDDLMSKFSFGSSSSVSLSLNADETQVVVTADECSFLVVRKK